VKMLLGLLVLTAKTETSTHLPVSYRPLETIFQISMRCT
jgi:hypothetical protein